MTKHAVEQPKNAVRIPFWQQAILFLLMSAVVIWSVGGWSLIQFVPHSAHSWRQGDGASIALNAWQDGWTFAPRIHNGMKGDGHTCVEFPIIYYLSALFYPFFGDADWVMRGWSLAFWTVGLLALSRLIRHLSGSLGLALVLPMLLLSAPILVFYGINYMPNVPAMGVVFVSWLFFYYFLKTRNWRWMWAFQGISLVAGMMKPTLLVSWVAFLLCFTLFNRLEKSDSRRYTGGRAIWWLVPLGITAWRWWTANYNDAHNTTGFFLVEIMPIWRSTENSFRQTWLMFNNLWSRHIAHEWLYGFVGFSTFFILIQSFFKKVDIKIVVFFGLMVGGVTCYFLLWFIQIEHHDYYFTEVFTAVAALFVAIANWWKRFFVQKNLQNGIVKTLILGGIVLLTVKNISRTKKVLWNERFDPTSAFIKDGQPVTHDKRGLRQWLTQNGVAQTDTVLSIPDGAPNHSLYFLNRVGYTRYNWLIEFGSGPVPQSWVDELVQGRKVKYLVVTDTTDRACDSLRFMFKNPISSFENRVFLYDLRQFKPR